MVIFLEGIVSDLSFDRCDKPTGCLHIVTQEGGSDKFTKCKHRYRDAAARLLKMAVIPTEKNKFIQTAQNRLTECKYECKIKLISGIPDRERYNHIDDATLQTGEEGKNARREATACRIRATEKSDPRLQAADFQGEQSVSSDDPAGGPGGIPVQLSSDLRCPDRFSGFYAR
jgi:hypothetical protein